MTDIWDNVASSLHDTVAVALLQLRAQPIFESMGSEIERAFAAHIIIGAHISSMIKVDLGLPSKPGYGYFLAPQVNIGAYRVDFVFAKSDHFDRPSRWIVIECDGHDFHEKTKEQAAHDKARDRFLSSEVGRVLRFTGSEIYRDVAGCWQDVIKVIVAMGRDDR